MSDTIRKRRKRKKRKEMFLAFFLVFCLFLLSVFLVLFIHSLKQRKTIISQTDASLVSFSCDKKKAYDMDFLQYLSAFLEPEAKESFLARAAELDANDGDSKEALLALLLGDCGGHSQNPVIKMTYIVLAYPNDTEIIVKPCMESAAKKENQKEDLEALVHLKIDDMKNRAFYSYFFEKMPKAGNKITVLVKEKTLILVTQIETDASVLYPVFILDNREKQMEMEYLGERFLFDCKEDLYDGYLNVAQITIKDDQVVDVKPFLEKVSGKLLSIRIEEDRYRIELNDRILYSKDQRVLFYRLFGNIERIGSADLIVGADFTDFVVDEDGFVIAGLLARQDMLRTIRVAIKDDSFSNLYHERVALTAEGDVEIVSADEKTIVSANTVLEISPESSLFISNRILIKPCTNTCRIKVLSIMRSQGNPAYRGVIELEKTKDGILLVNELPVEEYLYSVLPSEMPASYPKEALKAQAVSARTYAYMQMEHSSMGKYGAHVDDSTAFQVYNNCQERKNSTEAVCETQNQVLLSDGKLVSAYFYSTSCGMGTDESVWSHEEDEPPKKKEYLKATLLLPQSNDKKTKDETGYMQDNAAFEKYIKSFPQDYYESNESYFRWKYETDFDLEKFYDRLKEIYEQNEKNVLTKKGDTKVSLPIHPSGDVKMLSVINRASGGAATKLCVETEEKTYYVITELAIRKLLAGESSDILLGNKYENVGSINSLLPSAFFAMDVHLHEEVCTGYTLYGGGYGHGIGMSQNGAKNMALSGLSYTDILAAFYPNTELLE